ncbi:hypothetical protein KKH39_05130 [Patescibacteria group bacterium]|nr:hypothetical protein [Patescibacteria group bacterium]
MCQRETLRFESIEQVKQHYWSGEIDLETAQILAGMLTVHSPCQIISDGKEFLIFKKIEDSNPQFDDYPEVDHGY